VERFKSLHFSPSIVRRNLRERLTRSLPNGNWSTSSPTLPGELPDESVLALLLQLGIEFEADDERVRRHFEALAKAHPQVPSLDALLDDGTLRLVWGRFHAGREVRTSLQKAGPDIQAVLEPVSRSLHARRFQVPDGADDLVGYRARTLREEPDDVGHLPVVTPTWVMARLWERAPETLGPVDRLRFWLDRCRLLRDDDFAPSLHLQDNAATAIRNAAVEVLSRPGSFFNWEGWRDHLMARGRAVFGWTGKPSPPTLPAALVDRYEWLDSNWWQHVRDDFECCGDLWHIADLLLCDAEVSDQAPAPHPAIAGALDIAFEHPELLSFLTLKVQQKPLLLADLIVDPRFCVLACLLIAKWRGGVGYSELGSREHEEALARVAVFTDAVEITLYFLETASLPPAEFAALLITLHRQTQPEGHDNRFGVDARMLGVIRATLPRLPSKVLVELAAACVAGDRGEPDAAALAASLDVVANGTPANFASDSIVRAYVQVVGVTAEARFRMHTISRDAAAALARLAYAGPPELWAAYLSPFDLTALLAGRTGPEVNPYTLADDAALVARAHIRMLARAAAGWSTPPPTLLKALTSLIHVCSKQDVDAGRVNAFSVGHERDVYGQGRERSIARDLADALSLLAGEQRSQLLEAVLLTDEPLVLAELVVLVPHEIRERITARIALLTPARAGSISSLTDVQARIDALLSAGLADAAALFIEEEKGLKTLGDVRGRDLARLTAELRLCAVRDDWARLQSVEVPHSLKGNDEANETLHFYRALADLSAEPGDAAAAEDAFGKLKRRRPDIAAYGVNLLAATSKRLLEGDLFRILHGADAGSAREALAESADVLTQGSTRHMVAIHLCNQALLLLALGRPEEARDTLAKVAPGELEDRVAAYHAVALFRIGESASALGQLAKAEKLVGESDVIRAARQQLAAGAPANLPVAFLNAADVVGQMRSVLAHLKSMDVSRQASALQPPPDGLEKLVIEHVRTAAAGVTALVPMMKIIKIDRSEDDLSAMVQAILGSRLSYIGWDVGDQSRGGFTAKGNAGERDLTLRKDTVVVAVIEALVCRRPPKQKQMRENLRVHFHRLLSYGTCPIFVHLTYAYIAEAGSVLPELKAIASSDPPEGFVFQNMAELPVDGRPPGFVATYATSTGEVTVAFMVLDMLQQAQRNAGRGKRSAPVPPSQG